MADIGWRKRPVIATTIGRSKPGFYRHQETGIRNRNFKIEISAGRRIRYVRPPADTTFARVKRELRMTSLPPAAYCLPASSFLLP
ncbi:MAG: hypothetical protein U9R40_06945, partial [Synergistota bacterium]|nr:hypothetical protein [Synergistota bacterium]